MKKDSNRYKILEILKRSDKTRFNKDWNDSYYDPSLMTTITIKLPVYKLNKVQDMRYREGLSMDQAFIRPLELVLG